jgi:hypothetical protein
VPTIVCLQFFLSPGYGGEFRYETPRAINSRFDYSLSAP